MSFYELLENSFKNNNEKDERGATILYKAAEMSTRKKENFLVRKGAMSMQEVTKVLHHCTGQYR